MILAIKMTISSKKKVIYLKNCSTQRAGVKKLPFGNFKVIVTLIYGCDQGEKSMMYHLILWQQVNTRSKVNLKLLSYTRKSGIVVFMKNDRCSSIKLIKKLTGGKCKLVVKTRYDPNSWPGPIAAINFNIK